MQAQGRKYHFGVCEPTLVLLELKEDFKAIKAAEKCVLLAPNFVYGYLTLGRAQINRGELGNGSNSSKNFFHSQNFANDTEMALETFKKATQFSANEEIEEKKVKKNCGAYLYEGSNNAKTF